MGRIAVVGIGNVLMGDDALGAHVVKRLEAEYEVPGELSVVEAGTPGAALPDVLAGFEAVVVVDTVKVRGSPGEMRVLDKTRLLAKDPVLPMSPHEPGLREALFAMEFQGIAPREVLLVGVVPGEVVLAVGLSPPVAAAVPGALAEVVRTLEALGVKLRRREEPAAPDLWWERTP
ncbi:MAG TPA: hydrogenase maturation protease [Anaeromyxobacteraceae bacterium]|nr:hydrogenase maturation protease [Anaeromyxobacteraceae bacterium]